MAIAWDALKERYSQVNQELLAPDLESSKRLALSKEHGRLTQLLNLHADLERIDAAIANTQEQAASNNDPEMGELYAQELADLELKKVIASRTLDETLFPSDPHDDRSVFLEIRAGAGGQEAALFVADLQTMYTNYAAKMGWKVVVESISQTEMGGFREIVLHIKGKGVYGHLKYESGVHRVQRVPATETQGRIHTSTVTVAVLPEAEEVDVSINPSDLRIDVYRSVVRVASM